jgi:hypothetical protein
VSALPQIEIRKQNYDASRRRRFFLTRTVGQSPPATKLITEGARGTWCCGGARAHKEDDEHEPPGTSPVPPEQQTPRASLGTPGLGYRAGCAATESSDLGSPTDDEGKRQCGLLATAVGSSARSRSGAPTRPNKHRHNPQPAGL